MQPFKDNGIYSLEQPVHTGTECGFEEDMVRPEGFEPPTLWFEAKCSIQLSYGRGKQVVRVLKIANNSPHGNYAAATGSGGGGVTNIGIVSTMSKPARRRS